VVVLILTVDQGGGREPQRLDGVDRDVAGAVVNG
jgi:hypothetical protein